MQRTKQHDFGVSQHARARRRTYAGPRISRSAGGAMAMKLWRYVLALSLACLLVAPSVSAQSPAPSPADSPTRTGTTTQESSKAPAKRKGGGRTGSSREQLTAVQQALKDKGYDPGEVDGAMGPKTRAAVRDFQKKEGLRVTGRIDPATVGKLGIDSAKTAGSGTRSGAEVKPTSGAPASPAASPAGANPPAAGVQQLGEPKK